jgi:type IV fimbrial biogenesis protein FimT
MSCLQFTGSSPSDVLRTRGFTLVELVVALAILAIGVSFALPQLNSFVRRAQITSATNDLLAAIQTARAEAIKRSAPVAICSSTNGITCGSTANVWETGFIVFVDNVTPNGTRQAPGEVLISSTSAFPAGLTIQSTGSGGRVRFAPNGLMWGGAVGMRFEVANPTAGTSDERRYICVAQAGRAAAMNSKTFLNDPRFQNCGN